MNKKTKNIITTLYIIALITLLAGTTFSYFTVINVASVSPKVETQTASLNYILFDVGNDISISPTVDNFQEGMGNLSSETYARAYLKHSEGDVSAGVKYNILLNIENNTLTYSTGAKLPELILEVTDNDGNVISSIDGLNYKEVVDGEGNTLKGFDITEVTGTYYITQEKEVTTESVITHMWNIKVTYVNLGENQNNNYSKELKGNISIEKVA